MAAGDRVSRAFAWLLRVRVVVLVGYALVVPVAAMLATRIPSQGAIAGLIIPTDPDVVATRTFQAIFPESEMMLLVFESDHPWPPGWLAHLCNGRDALAKVQHVASFSVLDALAGARPGAPPEVLHQLAAGTKFF